MDKPIHIIAGPQSVKTASHFWGPPLLPPGYPYPEYTDSDGERRPYNFICQINLADIAPFDTDGRLPHEGLLLFFTKINHYLGDFEASGCIGGYVSDAEDVKVLHFPDSNGFEEILPTDFDGAPFPPEKLPMTFSGTPEGKYCDEHMLFAPPSHREWENWDPPFEDWAILLQVDSFSGEDFNLNFMDCGVLDFLISHEDLAARRFGNVRAIVLST